MRDPLTILTYALGATAFLLLLLGLWWWWRREHVDASEAERRRRLRINRIGRLAEGRIVDLIESSGGGGAERMVLYNYSVRGVEYQAAQDIGFWSERVDLRRVAAGQATRVKYDPHNPTNSIVLCEEWSGI